MARILLVNGGTDTRAILRAVLERDGHQVLEALNGPEALELVRRERPQLVVGEYPLGMADGRSLVRTIKSDPRTASTLVLAFTAHALNGDRERILAEGCDRYVSKPADPFDVVDVISEMLVPQRRYAAD